MPNGALRYETLQLIFPTMTFSQHSCNQVCTSVAVTEHIFHFVLNIFKVCSQPFFADVTNCHS